MAADSELYKKGEAIRRKLMGEAAFKRGRPIPQRSGHDEVHRCGDRDRVRLAVDAPGARYQDAHAHAQSRTPRPAAIPSSTSICALPLRKAGPRPSSTEVLLHLTAMWACPHTRGDADGRQGVQGREGRGGGALSADSGRKGCMKFGLSTLTRGVFTTPRATPPSPRPPSEQASTSSRERPPGRAGEPQVALPLRRGWRVRGRRTRALLRPAGRPSPSSPAAPTAYGSSPR